MRHVTKVQLYLSIISTIHDLSWMTLASRVLEQISLGWSEHIFVKTSKNSPNFIACVRKVDGLSKTSWVD
jgi:hypothetical protein